MFRLLPYFLVDSIAACFGGFLFWAIVTELQKGNIDQASIFFALLIFGIFSDRSIKISQLNDKEVEND